LLTNQTLVNKHQVNSGGSSNNLQRKHSMIVEQLHTSLEDNSLQQWQMMRGPTVIGLSDDSSSDDYR
jgi:hypothetical protein